MVWVPAASRVGVPQMPSNLHAAHDRRMTTSLPARDRFRTARRILMTLAVVSAAVMTVLAPTPTSVAAAGTQLYTGYNEYSTTVSCASIALR